MDELFSVKDKVVAITGGAGVLCGVIARELARRGAKVCVIDFDVMRANELCQEIEAEGGVALPVQANVLERKAIEEAFFCAVESFGQIDVLINGAGGNQKDATCAPPRTFFELPEDSIRKVFDLNCMGAIMPSQVFGEHMAERGEGVILNIASMNAFRPLTNIAAYSAAKAAIANFTQWLSTYMCQRHGDKMRVNAIAPGFCATEQNRYLLFDKNGQLTERGKTILKSVPQNRFGESSELTAAAIWLLSDSASFATGSVITIDGGFDAFSGV